jgi:hypothetical protein
VVMDDHDIQTTHLIGSRRPRRPRVTTAGSPVFGVRYHILPIIASTPAPPLPTRPRKGTHRGRQLLKPHAGVQCNAAHDPTPGAASAIHISEESNKR